MDWGHILSEVITGTVLVQFGVYYERRRQRKAKKYPFKWACAQPACTFFISGSDEKSVITIGRDHRRWHDDQSLLS